MTPEWEVTIPETNPQMLTHLQVKQRWGRNPHQPQREVGQDSVKAVMLRWGPPVFPITATLPVSFPL